MNVSIQNPKVESAETMKCGRSMLGTVTMSEDFPGDRGRASVMIIFDNAVDMRALAASLEKTADQMEVSNTEDAA